MNRLLSLSISYAQNLLSILFTDPKIASLINSVYLYGSAVRGELTAESDLDLFIDCSPTLAETLEKSAKAALSRFYQSKDFEKWKLLRFTHPISLQAGQLNQWELKSSIEAEGIILYSKKPSLSSAERQMLLVFTLPKSKKKYLYFIRALFGRKEREYTGGGLLEELGGRKLSSTVVIVPKENSPRLIQYFNKEKINYTLSEICIFTP